MGRNGTDLSGADRDTAGRPERGNRGVTSRTVYRRAVAAYSIAMLAVLHAPLVVLIAYSFNDSRINAAWLGFTWKWYVSLLGNERVLEALGNSLYIAAMSTLIAALLGVPAAVWLHRRRRSALWSGLFYLPQLMPDIFMGLALLILFSRLSIPLGKWTVIAAHVTFCIPVVVLFVLARLSGIGRELEEAAYDLGATPRQTFFRVTLPLLVPAIVSAMLLSFTMSLDDFVITFFVAGPESTTLPLYIYGLVKRGVSPEINALSALMVAVTILLVAGAELVRRRGETPSRAVQPKRKET